ncbi:MAG TPA: hypothetical protein VJ958_00835 [Atribacterota bacterium]|nr:hypothetical protein [Atribacterota bacterium]
MFASQEWTSNILNKLSGVEPDNIVWTLVHQIGETRWLKVFNHVIINRENLSYFEWMIPEAKDGWFGSHN